METATYATLPLPLREEMWKLYEESFPDYERRSRTAQERALGDNAARNMILYEGDTLVALLFYWMLDETVYAEFLAVNPAMRGRKTGSKVMEQFLAENAGRTVILEIEPPEDELTIRRLHFYERLGFVANRHEYTHPSYRTGISAHPHRLAIMSYGKPLDDTEFAGFVQAMHNGPLRYSD